MNTNDAMRIIMSLDPDAALRFSLWTGKWFVMSCMDITNGTSLSGISEHRDTPDEAVHAFLASLQAVGQGGDERAVVARALESKHRRCWRWNGAAFAEVSSDMVGDRA